MRFTEYAAMARAAEESGFHSIWIGDHLLYAAGERAGGERGPLEAWTLLSALSAVTERVVLGPLVACAGFHPPGLIAKMAATIAEVSGGRFVLGLGAGWNEREYRAFGIAFDHRVSRFEESFTIVRRLLAGERVTLGGRFWQADDAVLVPLPERPPRLMVGSNGPRMLAITLPHVDAWNTWYEHYGNTAEGFAELDAHITRAARDAGRDPEEIARSACMFVRLDRAAQERRVTAEAPPVEGSAQEIAERVRELADAGADEVILVVSPITERSIRELGEVVSAVAGRSP